MIRKVKVMGLAAFAVLALAAFGASAASAATFTSEISGTTNVTGTQEGNHVFDAAGNSISCTSAVFNGSQSGNEAPTLRTSVTYDGCTAFGIVGVAVNMHDCEYLFNANGNVSVVSKAGGNCDANPITYVADAGIFGECEVRVGATGNANLSGVTYTNIANGDITVTPNVGPITYTQSGGLCGSHNEGRYTSGNTVVAGTNASGGAPVNISVDTP